VKLNHKYRKMLFGLMVNPLPTSARGELLTDEGFCKQFGITPAFWFPLDAKTAAEVDSLHDALRAAVSGKSSVTLKLRDGRKVRAKLGVGKNGEAMLQIRKKGFAFSDADVLAWDREKRLKALSRVFASRPLGVDDEERWQSMASNRALTDREYVDLMTALAATPESVRDRFLKPQNLDSEQLIPDAPEYYTRLVGPFPVSTGLDAYMRNELAVARKALIEGHPKRGLRRLGFAALWQPLIPFDLLSSMAVADIASLLHAEDPFSLLCGFELCRARLHGDAAFADLGASFLKKLLLEGKASIGRCHLFSACALISSTNVRRAARAANAPLFWTRLAALAHAGVLADALRGIPNKEGFLKWSVQNWYPNYLWESVIDRRDAPRWSPEWISPDHLYAELVGRAQGALQILPTSDRPASWTSAIDDALAQLKESRNLLAAYFPGPFDDFRDVATLSSTIEGFREVETELERASRLGEVPELFALAYAADPSDGVVANVLRLISGAVDKPLSDQKQVPLLQLCAYIAACKRNKAIADAVMNRCLFLVQNIGHGERATDLFLVMAHACAALARPEEHRKLLGEAAVRLCFALSTATDLSSLGLIFDVLAMRDEKLSPALARARAIRRTKLDRLETAA
jgi:hypothetical protein